MLIGKKARNCILIEILWENCLREMFGHSLKWKKICNFEKGKSLLRKRFQTPKLIQFRLFQNGLMLIKAWKWGENCFAISLFFPFLDLLMVVARIFLRIKAKNDGWGGVRRISNILGQILVHYYCCIGTKPSFHGAVDSISNLSYLIIIFD